MDADTVHVWLIDADVPDPVYAQLLRVLDAGERKRANAIGHERDRRRFVVAHGGTRVIVGAHLGAPAEQLRWRRGRHGKPELTGVWTGVHVNLSHSADLSAVALSAGRRVGIDVQQLLPGLDVAGLAARFFPTEEARFVAAAQGPRMAAARFARLWTRKEACVKASGGRLTQGLALPVRGAARMIVLPGPYLVSDVQVPPGFCGAVALEGTAPYRVVRQWWRGVNT